MRCYETNLTDAVLAILLQFSADWEAEDSCYGYRRNSRQDIEGTRIFLAEQDGKVSGYLFGRTEFSKNRTSIMPEGTACFEIEELYVVPELRSQGIGAALMHYAENAVKEEADFLMLSTATKNWKAILHFYIDQIGMEFWSARLYKSLKSGGDI